MSGLTTKIKVTSISVAFGMLCSCAATQTAIEHGKLNVSSRMSESIFVEPVSKPQKTVFVSVKNTSDQTININKALAHALELRGYKVVHNPKSAHFMLQANILKIGKMSRKASEAAMGSGFGSTLAGIGTGVAVGSLANSSDAMIAGGLIGGGLSIAADALIKDVNYAIITDVQLSERAGRGMKVEEQFNSHLQNGQSSNTVQRSNQVSSFRHYRTRIVSNADKVNLQFAEARPVLEQSLVKVMSGIL